jgi:CRP-like cAMP-binding protein
LGLEQKSASEGIAMVAKVKARSTMAVVPCSACPLRLSTAFKPISAQQIARIERMRVRQIEVMAGAAIVEPDIRNANLYTLFSGWAFRYKMAEDGRRQILNFLLPGDLVGLQAAMFEPSHHGIIALTDVRLCLFPRRNVWKLFGSVPDLAFDLTWLGAREESLVDHNMLTVGQLDAAERVATLIISLHKRLDALGLVKDNAFDCPLSQQHLADALGLSLAHVNRTVAGLRRRGLLEWTGNRVVLKQPKLLERGAEIYESAYVPRPLI